ncbi:4'-phosphopantetheinyl transferase superfamily protein [Pseudohaliea sp.]|uniref:4'-phosphopantetheinyl transferase family protein n=1 Tax=Pseudohaliea sp. TaxID=2740289 RepID=UPI0032ECA5A7
MRLCRARELDPALARRYYAALDGADRERVDRLPAGRRAPMLLARGLLRIELARVLGTAPGALRFERGPSGKPSVAGAPQLCFNLSHAGDWAALAWLAQPAPTPAFGLGVDLECAQPARDVVRLATRCFGKGEGARVAALPAPEAAARFRDRWTLAEAWVKAQGGSLARVLGTPALPQPPVGARRGSRAAADGEAAASWLLLAPAPELTLALWLEGAGSLRPRLSQGLPLRQWRPVAG